MVKSGKGIPQNGAGESLLTRPSALGMSDPIMDHCNEPVSWESPAGTTKSMSSCPPYPGVGEVASL